MAHANMAFQRNATALLATAAMALALPAGAVRLGEMQVHSPTGEPLDATFALKPSPGEALDPDCFFLGRARATDLLIAARATFAVESDGAAPRLRLRTGSPIPEVELRLRIHASCPGGRSVTRDYTARLFARAALPPVITPASAPTPVAATAPVALADAGLEFRAMPGDTFASIATAIYPGNASARAAYVQAIRSANPGLADLADDDALPPGTMFALPDLRKFSLGYAAVAKARPRPTEMPKRPAAAAPPPAPKADLPKLPKATVDLPKAPVAKVEPRASPAALPAAPRGAAGAFVLKLSSPEVDLSRSRGIDERKRAQIRERRLVLDADDQVAAVLAMRNTVKQLESRVAELQLKLSALPPAAAAPPAKAPAPPPAKAPAPPPAKAPAPPPAMAPAPVAAPPVSPAPAPQPAVAPQSPPAQQDFMPVWLWGVLALLAAAVGAAVWWMRSRSRPPPPEPLPAPVGVSDLDVAEALMRAADGVEPQTPAQAGEHRVVADSDASLATRVPGADPVALRRRYIEERFPEISGGTIVLDEPESVVKAARLFYEDGAVARAVELLQFVVEEKPATMKPWLALFEIFRLESLPGEFAELAGRFREHSAASDSWRKVQFIGREFDPQNPLYRDEAFNSLETIGPTAPKRAPVTFDALAENWLNAPMDFTTDALASGLRAALLTDAGLQDADLLPDPMPALKNVEMFNVA